MAYFVLRIGFGVLRLGFGVRGDLCICLFVYLGGGVDRNSETFYSFLRCNPAI